MTNFALGVVSSLIATLLTVAAGLVGAARMRRIPIALLSRVTGLGIRQSFAQQKVANAELAGDLAQARWVKVLAGRGNELTRDSFRSVWEQADSRLDSVQILLPNPSLGDGSFLADREAEIRRHDSGFRPGLLSEQVRSNIEYISAIASQRSNVELRLYDAPNVCRIILTDKVAYLTTYTAGDHGRNSPCMVFTSPGTMYDFSLRLFSVTWGRAVAVPTRAQPPVS
jgi:hypothetical protein